MCIPPLLSPLTLPRPLQPCDDCHVDASMGVIMLRIILYSFFRLLHTKFLAFEFVLYVYVLCMYVCTYKYWSNRFVSFYISLFRMYFGFGKIRVAYGRNLFEIKNMLNI